MSWQAKLLGLVGIPAFFLLGACERDDLTIGLPPGEAGYDLGYYEYQVEPMNMIEDSIQRTATGRIFFGRYDDPFFGETIAKGFTSLNAGNNLTPPFVQEGAIADSMVLSLQVDYVYGNSDINLDISVMDLTLTLQDTLYKTNQDQFLQFSDELTTIVEEFPLQTYLNDSSVVITAHLNPAFAQQFLDEIRQYTGNFQEGDSLKKFITGLAFIPNIANDGIIGIDAASADTNITLYYTDVDGDNGAWQMGFSGNQHYMYVEPNNLVPGRSGTALEGFTDVHTDFVTADEYTYFHTSTGLGITMDVSDLLALGDTLDNTVISTAVLEIENVGATDLQNVPPVLRALLIDENNIPLRYNNQILRTLYQGSRSDSLALSVPGFVNGAREEFVNYIEERDTFVLDLTLYIQAILEGRMDLTKIWICDVPIEAEIGRFRTLKENVKIKIYYTKIN